MTREHPFFYPGASTSVMFCEGTGSGLVQTSSEASQLTATQPTLGVPSTNAERDVSAIRPVQGPGAGTATQPPQAPGAGPEVLPTGYET